MVHDSTDLLILLRHMNTDPEQNRCDNIAYCLDNQYHTLRKNEPANADFFFGDDLPTGQYQKQYSSNHSNKYPKHKKH